MLIQITNSCQMGCKHCMQDSTPDGKMMSQQTFNDTLEWIAKRFNYATSNILLISGGEPTDHTEFFELMKRVTGSRYYKQWQIAILSNGLWIKDAEKVAKMRQLFAENPNLSMQISAFRKYYKSTDFILEHLRDFAKVSKRIFLEDIEMPLNILDIGRARENCRDELYDGYANCMSFALTAKQLGLDKGLLMNVARGKFCTPLIDYRGYLHFGESALCKPFGSIYDDMDVLEERIKVWKPCMLCSQSKKVYDGTMKSKQIREILKI